ncbi:hydrocephalus-inducing protein-like [Solea senegalensis]|uniref:Hydrocephalus-inducing protein-like n=1 Tax=Solea senegalensis TaxID=28829 RepID=A0AAV6SUK2_SOLSE|nr:hydrocephalus-inducing protein homolog isoform X2 [Solea senegalensis]KAG7521590.1 hydrocephalus-inducing protein-like [Solea senegalensis]
MAALLSSFYNLKPVLKEDKQTKVTPSVYTQEMSQSAEERLANTREVHPPRILELLDMSKTTHHKLTTVDMDQALFQPYPSELVFQNFTPAQTYKLPLRLLNMDKVPRQVKVELQDSEFFHVVAPENALNKVAPRCSVTFTVFFTPQENKDHDHRLVFATDRERFEVPVRAIGPRAILSFRDELQFPLCLVKASTERTQQIINIGNDTANFELHTQRPFSVTPSCGTLEVGENMQVVVNFNPITAGEHRQDLRLHYHTGEDVYVSLCGLCEELALHLEPDSLTMNRTYVSLASAHKVSLSNRSDSVLQYQWTLWSSQEEEDLILLRESSVFQKMAEEEREQLLSQYQSDPTAIQHFPLLARALQDGRSQSAQDLLTLSHSCVTLEPAKGEIWPRMTQTFTIIFKPKEAELYQQTVYCDVTGRQSRLPLTLQGEGMGPKLQLDYNLMNMKNVFVGDTNCYEVLVSNKGLIDAHYTLSCPDTTFGRCFSFSPADGVIPTEASQTVRVTFLSSILGKFSEDLLLSVKGQPEPLTLTFRGCVVGPTFHFNVLELDFGDVAFGFPQTLTFTLFNTSFVPMNFSLRVLGDGLGSRSVTGAKQASEASRNNWQGSAARDPHARPVEFSINPAVDSVRAMSDVTIKVTLCSNTVKTYRLAMVVDVDGVGEEIRTLPINARCVVPEIVVETPVLEFERCFLNYPCEQQVQLTNPSSLPACYGLLDQEYEESPLLLFDSSSPRGVIPPHASEQLPVTLLAKATGRLRHTLRIAVFGSTKPPLEVVLSCTGQGPLVHVQSPQLDFGRIPVLTDITRTLHLSNHSPIPASFTTRTSHRKSFWRVEPSEGEVPPESQLELRVVAHLKDTIDFQEKLKVSIQDSQTHMVHLSATGTGTTIVSDRPLAPSLDLGTHFSHELCQYHFKLTNLGQRTHWMYWGTDGSRHNAKTHNGDSLSFLPPISPPKKKDVHIRGSLVAVGEEPVFGLTPSRVKLLPGCSVDMVLTGYSDTAKVVQERLVCRGTVGDHACKEQIMSVDVSCRFVAPLLSVSSKQLNFCIEKVPGENLEPIYEKLVLKNVSSLCLSMKLSVEEPFSLCDAPRTQSSVTTKSVVLGDGKQADLWICFNPDYYQDQVSRVVDKFLEMIYQGHPQQDMVELHAEVHFPNLHFSSSTVDFGCVLNYTETHSTITMTNCSKLPVSYSWTFLEDPTHCINSETDMDKKKKRKTQHNEKEGRVPSSRTPSPGSPAHVTPREKKKQPPAHVEEVFDVLPMSGLLQPGEKQNVTLSFFGHENISMEAVAQCHVQEGPTYGVKLRGEASVNSYSLDSSHIDFGRQLFDHLGEAEVTLRNTGRVGFSFEIIHLDDDEEEVVVVEPKTEARQPRKATEEDEQPHTEEEEVPEIRLGEPLVIPRSGYIAAGAEQRLHLLFIPGTPEVFEKRLSVQVAFLPAQDITVTGEGFFPRIILNLPRNLQENFSEVVEQARVTLKAKGIKDPADGRKVTTEDSTFTYEELLHMEIDRALVKDNALAMTGSLVKLRDEEGSYKKWYRLGKFVLPEYMLDFGYVILGRVHSHTVTVTNAGLIPVSFHANLKPLTDTGFSAEFERVKNLPCGEAVTFTVDFDPQRANLPTGKTCVVMPIQVTGGPTVHLRLCAVVTMPAVTISTDTLQFDPIQCGMCQIRTIQLLNHEPVHCLWSIAEDVKPLHKVNKFLPSYLRKKILQGQEPLPAVFVMIPSSGTLAPGERVNVQIRFSPTEELSYNRQLVVHVEESSKKLSITAQGQGEDPQLEFYPSVLELRPCLPASHDAEAEVIVKNRYSFPIEFYSLDFDTQYLQEEKIMRVIPGYDDNNILLLPPRVPGEGLPKEVIDYYKKYCSQLKDSEISAEISRKGPGLSSATGKGIAVIVYGAPLTDGSYTAIAVAQHYGGACLTVDAVVTDVLKHGTSPIARKARQLYDSAASVYGKNAGLAKHVSSVHAEARHSAHRSSSLRVSSAAREAEKPYMDLCLGGTVTTLCRLLPDQLLVDILAERFQANDCHRGVVIEGLKSVFTESVASTLQLVLKALKNRKYIYAVNLYDSYTANLIEEKRKEIKEKEEAGCNGEMPTVVEKTHTSKKGEQVNSHIPAAAVIEETPKEREEEEDSCASSTPTSEDNQSERKRDGVSLSDSNVPDVEEEKGKERTDGTAAKHQRRRKEDMVSLSDSYACIMAQDKPQKLQGSHAQAEDESQKRTDITNMLLRMPAVMKYQQDHPPPAPPADSSHHPDAQEKEEALVNELLSLFSAYKLSKMQVEHILQHWDRTQAMLLFPVPQEEAPPVPEEVVVDKRNFVDKKGKKANPKAASPMPSQMIVRSEAVSDRAKLPKNYIPLIVLNLSATDGPHCAENLLKGTALPSLDEVLDDLGLGATISPTVTLSIFPFPKDRQETNNQPICDCFTLLDPSGLDKHSEEMKDLLEDVLSLKDKDKRGRECQRAKRQASAKAKPKGSTRCMLPVSAKIDCNEQEQHLGILELKRQQSLKSFRWVIPAKSEVVLKIWFYSDSLGTFEQVFNFELVGNLRHYKLLCRGVCTYPAICQNYMTLFAHSKKVPQIEEGLHKTYIINPGYFEFGPLICGKTRERYKENEFPENTERFVIQNNSGMEAEVQFHFHHDHQAATYLLDPTTMTLKPYQKRDLKVWAYPTKVGHFKDSVVCCIKDNPDVVVINISCWGAWPELELENKHMHFDRILLHRRESRSVTLHNKTALPVSWKLHGLEDLGDEFSVPEDHGTILPHTSYPLTVHFGAKRPLHIKKLLRLEVCDEANILGIVNTENIKVSAEAYDINLAISPDGCLDFGTIKVFNESKMTLKMKNQGKYEIAYTFSVKRTNSNQPKLDSMFTVSPQYGSLKPHEKATIVSIIFNPTAEVSLKEQAVLPCQVIEPHIGSVGEIIAMLSFKVSAQAVFSRYKISPAHELNFGPLVYHGSKRSQSFIIVNNGLFEYSFAITNQSPPALIPDSSIVVRGPVKKIQMNAANSRARRESLQKDTSIVQSRLAMGIFSVTPCTGNLKSGCQQMVIVDCAADQLGSWSQGLLINITGRDPADHPNGIPYKLLAEVCKPSILLDVASVFEEHHLCHTSQQLSSEEFSDAECIYVLDENKLIFNKVLVGQTGQARIKLTNNSKVPCVLFMCLKLGSCKASRNVDVFDLSTTTLTLPSKSHTFVVVTFTPRSTQLYSSLFEVAMEGASRATPLVKNKVLEFDLMGEGNLPSVCVVHPSLMNSRGSLLLPFRRVLLGQRRSLPLVLLNDGKYPAQVQIDLQDKHGVFTLESTSDCSSIYTDLEGDDDSDNQAVRRATLTLNVNEQVEFEVSFCSNEPLSVKAKMTLQVEDNKQSRTIIKVTGESHPEMISLDNISRCLQEMDQEDYEKGSYEVLNFGDCHVDCRYEERFTMTNHSSNQAMRFEWPSPGHHIIFSPQVGHLHAGCSKEVTVTFSSGQPVTLNGRAMICKLHQLVFQQPIDQVPDWDDQKKTVQWLSDSEPTSGTQSQQTERRKVTKTEPEPGCSTLHGSERELELRIKAACDYAKFTCSKDSINFRDTLLYQTRVGNLQIANPGNVKVEFLWRVRMEANTSNVSSDQEEETSIPGQESDASEAAKTEAGSASAVSSQLPSALLEKPEVPPFSVEPEIGAIPPGSTQKFRVHFSPLEVAHFHGKLLCSIPNLRKGDKPPVITVRGSSLLPYFHFDLEDSDYISANRRSPEFRDPHDRETRVIEFNAVGLSVSTKRSFAVLNPTSEPYPYEWKCNDTETSSFRCLTPCGTILPGRKVEMCFEYVVEELDVVESYWSFVTETLSLSTPFLCVGNTREPLVYLSRPHLDFGELIVGRQVEQSVLLVNVEEEPFAFSVLQSSLLCEALMSSLVVLPMSGIVAPQQKLPLTVSFTPCREGYMSFRLVVNVKRRSEPLSLPVKADCFPVNALVQLKKPDGSLREIASNHQDTVDFGVVAVLEQSTLDFLVTNVARLGVEVNFNLTGPSKMLRYLELKPKSASILVGSQQEASLVLSPRANCILHDVLMSINIKHGPTFTFAVKGKAEAPNLEFSFTKYNFGKCFLYRPGMVPPSQTLMICNKGELDVSVQCQFEKSSCLRTNFQPDVLPPGGLMRMPVDFCPQETRGFYKKLTFVFNNCVTKQVEVEGQGIELKLEVENPLQRNIKLGSVTLGQKVKRQVRLINRSVSDVSFTLMITTNTPVDPKDLTVNPGGELNLKAEGGSCNVQVQFWPRHCVPLFEAKVVAGFSGLLHPLLTIHGCCQ